VRRPAASGGFGADLRTLTVLLDCAPSMSSTRIVSRQALDGLRRKKARKSRTRIPPCKRLVLQAKASMQCVDTCLFEDATDALIGA
jgi:hypothetical protein